MHGGLDGYSRIPVYLVAAENNMATTVLDAFESALKKYGLPSRVRSDKGGENVLVAALILDPWVFCTCIRLILRSRAITRDTAREKMAHCGLRGEYGCHGPHLRTVWNSNERPQTEIVNTENIIIALKHTS